MVRWVGSVRLAPSGQIASFFHDDPGRRCALPWARLCKPVGLSNPFALRATEQRTHRAAEQLAHRAAEQLARARARGTIGFGYCISPRMGQPQLSPGQSEAPPWVNFGSLFAELD